MINEFIISFICQSRFSSFLLPTVRSSVYIFYTWLGMIIKYDFNVRLDAASWARTLARLSRKIPAFIPSNVSGSRAQTIFGCKISTVLGFLSRLMRTMSKS